MSEVNVNREFSEFGRKMNLIAILTIVYFVSGIVFLFIVLAGIITLVLMIIISSLFISMLGNIKDGGYALNNQDLLEFRSKLLPALILGMIGGIILFIGTLGMLITGYIGGNMGQLILTLIISVIGCVFLIISAIFRVIGWGCLNKFFTNNMMLFPENISNDAKSGTNLCKIASILHITVILGFIGIILDIIGYFKLRGLKGLVGVPSQPIDLQQPSPEQEGVNYCPSCGTRVYPGTNYCPECGSELN